MSDTRIETSRSIAAPAPAIFAPCDPQGHVAIDATGLLQDAEGDPVSAAGDSFVIHVLGRVRPQIGHVHGYRLEPADGGDDTLVTSFYDWSDIHADWKAAGIFPVVSEATLKGTLGILDRTVRRGYPRG